MAQPQGSPVNIHATALVVGERGVLIAGASGSGKSRLAMDLLQAARSRGRFAALVSDDQVMLRRVDDRVIAVAPHSIRGLIEVRGVGILKRPYLDRAVMHLAVATGAGERLPASDETYEPVSGVTLPLLQLVPGRLRDPLEIIEAFAENRLLR